GSRALQGGRPRYQYADRDNLRIRHAARPEHTPAATIVSASSRRCPGLKVFFRTRPPIPGSLAATPPASSSARCSRVPIPSVAERRCSPTVRVAAPNVGRAARSRSSHPTVLGNLWQMFGRQSRFNWCFPISAVYGNAERINLLLPPQSDRTFWQGTLFDFREGKFHLNLYPSPELREAYAHHLCRE